jgi:ubiquitin-protein ligase E3 B
VRDNQGAITSEHPLLGWFTGSTPRHLLDCMPRVLTQLRLLWRSNVIRAAFADVWTETDRVLALPGGSGGGSGGGGGAARPGRRRGGLVRFFGGGKPDARSFVDATATMRVQRACAFYHVLCHSLQTAQLEVVGSLAFLPELVPRLWTFMDHIGPKGGMALFVDALPTIEKEPLVAMLSLATLLTDRLLTVMADEEVFVKEDPFSSQQLLHISRFLHEYVFRSVWEAPVSEAALGTADLAGLTKERTERRLRDRLRKATANLLARIRDIDSRQPFIPDDHWAIRNVASAVLLRALRTERHQQGNIADAAARQHKPQPQPHQPASAVLRLLPHILPFHARVTLLHEQANEDRARFLQSVEEMRRRPAATIRRNAVLGDGFREIMRLPADQLKDAVRIHFVNELGMAEAGIDQEGLFKGREGAGAGPGQEEGGEGRSQRWWL